MNLAQIINDLKRERDEAREIAEKVRDDYFESQKDSDNLKEDYKFPWEN